MEINVSMDLKGLAKPVKFKNKDYLKWIDDYGCLICGRTSTHCHVRRPEWGSGMGTKSHDYVCIPLCHDHHSYENERLFGTDKQIVFLLMEYIESKRKK